MFVIENLLYLSNLVLAHFTNHKYSLDGTGMGKTFQWVIHKTSVGKLSTWTWAIDHSSCLSLTA